MDGELIRDGAAFVLRFERDLPYPVERVWRAITDRSDLVAWFPSAVDLELHVGGKAIFVNDPDFHVDADLLATSGEVVELDPQRRFAFTWGNDLLRFELTPTDGGCRLVFTHRLPHRACVNRTAAGWSVCFDALTASLAGAESAGSGWQVCYDHYLARFGDAGVIGREGQAAVARFERLMPAAADKVWSALEYIARLDDSPGEGGEVLRSAPPLVLEQRWRNAGGPEGIVKWQLIPLGDASLLLLTQTVDAPWDAAKALEGWDRVLVALAASLA
ncbi:MAG TPA: SRPBCC family protein [Mycobacteriales bacterium]|jgi:uncharacterized protein YndB with AHSA1/START domain|nr:SRPBCC family protein [Mycobacteriales bacterium]